MRYVQSVGRRARIIGYGGSLVLVLIGALVAVLRSDGLGMAGSVALVSIGLVSATSLVFYEVGLARTARGPASRRPGDRLPSRSTTSTRRRRPDA